MIPLIIYPYAYLIFILCWVLCFGLNVDSALGINIQVLPYTFLGVSVLYNIYVIFIAIYNSIKTARNDEPVYEAAKMNLIVKGCQIPAYIFNFVLGLMGLVASVWGAGIIMVVVVVDFIFY